MPKSKSKKAAAVHEPVNLIEWLARYREERAAQPQFYYNELADRGQALARLRPALEDFVAGRTGLADFARQLSHQSRLEVSRARGRAANRYWRFNSAGRLFIDSYWRRAEEGSQLNAAERALQTVVAAPATLDRAGQQLEDFGRYIEGLNSTSARSEGLRPALAVYVASYCWVVQQPTWTAYERVAREQLSRAGRLTGRNGDSPAGLYRDFYLAYLGLARELDLHNTWELDSFLQWLSRRDLTATRLLSSRTVARAGRPQPGRPVSTPAEGLRELLEPLLRATISENLTGQSLEGGRLIFSEGGPEASLRLELRPGPGRQWLAGTGFDGLNPAALATPTGEATVTELAGFLAQQPAYHFYNYRFDQQPAPQAGDLAGEFWIMRMVPVQSGAAFMEELASGWRLLYAFAGRLIAPYDEENAPVTTPVDDENTVEFRYATAEPELRAVAEAPAPYAVEEQAGPQPPDDLAAYPAPDPVRDPAAQAEVLRLARFKPAPLSPDQLEALSAFIRERLVISNDKITEVVTHLEAGRNLLLWGPPGSGKTRLARLLAGQMGAPDPGWSSESEATAYTLTTATAEWSQYDTIGGIRPGLAGEGSTGQSLFYYFEPGVVARAAVCCEENLRRHARPHFLIIDEFNRANQERAFGELFTLLEYRDRPLLPASRLGRPADLFIPEAFRIIGTLNADDRNTLFEMGLALRRRFALVEIGLPPPAEERRFLPRAVKARLPRLELTPSGEFDSPPLVDIANQLTTFIGAVRPEPSNPASGGKEVGTAPLIECLLFCAVATSYYEDSTGAMEDAIMANLLPQLEGSPTAIKRALAAVSPGGPLAHLSRVRTALQRMTGYF